MNDIIIADTKPKIEGLRLLTLKAALGLEIKGMRISRGPSAFQQIKAQFGFKGSKQSVHDQFVAKLKEMDILQA